MRLNAVELRLELSILSELVDGEFPTLDGTHAF